MNQNVKKIEFTKGHFYNMRLCNLMQNHGAFKKTFLHLILAWQTVTCNKTDQKC